MDSSDEEAQRPKRPVFKKAKKSKTPNASRASRRNYEEVVEEKSDVATLSVEETTTRSKAMSKILRYRSLRNEDDEVTENNQTLPSDVPEIEPDAVVVDHVAAPVDNQAYTVVQVPSVAKTFSLRESHFREKPVEVTNEYGSDDDDIKPMAANDDSDQEMEVPNVDYTVSAPQADPDRYFTEIDLDEDVEEVQTQKEPSTVAAYIAQIKQKKAEYQDQIDSGKRALEMSQSRLEQLQARREEILEHARVGTLVECGTIFGRAEAFIRDLYRSDVDEKDSPHVMEREEVDMMSLYV